MVILVWYLSFGFWLLASVRCFALELTLTHRHGPEMCERLEKRGCVVTFHRENLTCVIHDESSERKVTRDPEEVSSKNKKKERSAQGELFAMSTFVRAKTIRQLPLSQRVIKDCDLRTELVEPTDMICSNFEKRIYFLHNQFSGIRVWILGQKRTKLLLQKEANSVYRIATDSKRKLLFGLQMKSIGVLNLTAKDPKFKWIGHVTEVPYHIALSTEKQLIFASGSSKIFSIKYNGLDTKTICECKGMRGLAFDSETEFIYFGVRNTLVKISVSGKPKWIVRKMNFPIQFIRVYHGIVYVSFHLKGVISAVEPRNGTILWTELLFHGKRGILFCLMNNFEKNHR